MCCVPVGPVARPEEIRRIAHQERIDAAILDVNLGGDLVFEAAEHLAARNVPLLFVTGYDSKRFPERFKRTARLEKPYVAGELKAKILELVGRKRAGEAATGEARG
jgi:DNA-binding response OmpR family regulator